MKNNVAVAPFVCHYGWENVLTFIRKFEFVVNGEDTSNCSLLLLFFTIKQSRLSEFFNL